MKLNLPIAEHLSNCKSILIAGMGGGYDIFCGLPIYFDLKERGLNVHLANYSFSGIAGLQAGGTVRLSKTLVGVTADYEREVIGYFPELYLTQWFKETRHENIIIWCFQKTGAKPLIENYRILTEHLALDALILIDGGVDALIRGDEDEVGTFMEDSLSLLAAHNLEHVPLKFLTCLGLGAEADISYAHIFENIADLTQADAFYGTCSLIKQMPAYKAYEAATTAVHSKLYQSPSVINASMISATQGHHGNFHLTEKTADSELKISPLMPIIGFLT